MKQYLVLTRDSVEEYADSRPYVIGVEHYWTGRDPDGNETSIPEEALTEGLTVLSCNSGWDVVTAVGNNRLILAREVKPCD